MGNSSTLKKSPSTGRFVTKALGKDKATKFSKVEGLTINSKSARIFETFSDRGLKGDALRAAITGKFSTKRGK